MLRDIIDIIGIVVSVWLFLGIIFSITIVHHQEKLFRVSLGTEKPKIPPWHMYFKPFMFPFVLRKILILIEEWEDIRN